MMQDNVLNDFYVQSLGFIEYTEFLSQAALQVAHRYPHMNILEIGEMIGRGSFRYD